VKASFCFLNGRFVQVRRATISVTDRGFLFGEGLFETWRTYDGRPFAVREHLARMHKAAKAIGIPFDPGGDWEARSVRLARLNRMTAGGGAVRLTITRGPGPVGLVPQPASRPTRLMLVRALEPGLAKGRSEGVGVHLMDFGRGVDPALRQLKTLNYLPAVRGKVAARRAGCFESLYRLQDGTVLEGTTSNFFVRVGGELLTTPITTGVLAGVTRSMVMRLAGRLLPVRERVLRDSDLRAADEIFLTASTIEVLGVTRIGRRLVGTGRVGELTRELQARYRRLVARRLGVSVGELGD
jgi:branched-subunit amino acid aminotransferase/4-amino-4-deoxychorismate lyase